MGDHLLDKHQLPPPPMLTRREGQCHEKWLGSVRQEELQGISAEGSWDGACGARERGLTILPCGSLE